MARSSQVATSCAVPALSRILDEGGRLACTRAASSCRYVVGDRPIPRPVNKRIAGSRAETARGPVLLVSPWFGPEQDFLHRRPAREGCNQIPPRLEAQGHEIDLSIHALKLHLYGWLGGVIQGPKVQS
jgi:hypothetical protein